MAAQAPWPSDPVATSTKGRRGVGCPSRSESNLRSWSSSSRGNSPASAQAEYRIGAACPLESTKASLCGLRGFLGSYRITEKNSVDMISAAEAHVVGWPLPAVVVERIE